MTTDKTPATLAVDVLAVMDRLQRDWRDESQIVGRWDSADDLAAVRAAVAELIEKVDELIKHTSGCEALLRVAQTETLSNAKSALARVKGESA